MQIFLGSLKRGRLQTTVNNLSVSKCTLHQDGFDLKYDGGQATYGTHVVLQSSNMS